MSRRSKFSDAPQMIGPKFRKPSRTADSSGKGDWYLILRSLECNGVCYLPLNHHLVETNSVPERVPSSGAKAKTIGDKSVPVDITGRIDVSGLPHSTVYKLFKSKTITPVDPVKSRERLEEGMRMARTAVTPMIPPVRRVNSFHGQYQQATNVPLSAEGIRNLGMAQVTQPNPFANMGR